ncbi:Flp pilus assembly complex ATPase component TadA [bacterium AH-315-I18]|nr:Flp pilus assembly complex ATPase component TadA [bacterium AH-315-I18]
MLLDLRKTLQETMDTPLRVVTLLELALQQQASDVHLEPVVAGYELRMRADGMLLAIEQFDKPTGQSMVTRLMVMAQLLTYRQDLPQEGRMSVLLPTQKTELDLRLAIMPTTQGLRAVVRMPAELIEPRRLDALKLSPGVLGVLSQFIGSQQGMLLVTGSSGSGKTTTIYALLDELARQQQGISIIALEDPVERDLPGVTQIQVQPFGELTYERALRSVLRQDPQVLMLGEIRDHQTAALAMGAALSGHRLIATFHAGSPAGAITRLLEMGIPAYQITSAVFAVMTQRLLRQLGEEGQYHGRVPVAEIAMMDQPLRTAILNQTDLSTLSRTIDSQPSYEPMSQIAEQMVTVGMTDTAEVTRILGANS